MDQTQIFLEKNKSAESVNKGTVLKVSLPTKSKLIPYNDIDETLSLHQLYIDERDNCEDYRLIFTVNPICSNVLFNTKTEVVWKEGSDDCISLMNKTGFCTNIVNTSGGSNVDSIKAIRDTEFTHPKIVGEEPYVYHCGWDIFNNHMLRNDDFVFVGKTDLNGTGDTQEFNTIFDFQRDCSGNTVSEYLRNPDKPHEKGKKTDLHIYQTDTVLSIYDAFANRIKEKDGWYGFTNPGNIDIPNVKVNNEWITVNKLMNNNKPCEFIDFYPDRSLYSFIPKVNKHRKRLEKNWDYCLTYPASNDREMLNTVMELNSGLTEESGGCCIKIIEAVETYTTIGTPIIRMESMLRHTLKKGDYINLYYVTGETGTIPQKYDYRLKVIQTGNSEGKEKNRYFSVLKEEMSDIFENKNVSRFYYKKLNGEYECQYYFRKFKKLNDDDFNSEINKLAYGENIYGDRVAQIIYTDDINTHRIDNLGRPLSEIYLTIVKANRGNKEWYNGATSGDCIEFSHCFGKVTSGLDLPFDKITMKEHNYNVRRLNNFDIEKLEGSVYETKANEIFLPALTSKIPTPLEDDITIDNNEFYGDIVEFDPLQYTETVIDNVYHRFNTVQRELTNMKYFDVLYDDLLYDDYDIGISNKDESEKVTGFTVSSYTYGYQTTEEGRDIKIPANIMPEGYFYNPHYKVQIKRVSNNVENVKGRKILCSGSTDVTSEYSALTSQTEFKVLRLVVSMDYGFMKEDMMAIYTNSTRKITWAYVYGYSSDTRQLDIFTTKETFENSEDSLIMTKDGVATYASYLPKTRTFVWRPLLKMSELTKDDELYDMPFTNGCNYIEKNIIFYLRRQDPRGDYLLLSPEDKSEGAINPLRSFRIWGYDTIDVSGVEYIGDKDRICY